MEEILDQISRLKTEHDRALIAIDGFGGAGKSSLARRIVQMFHDARHIEFDWFHKPHGEIMGDERFDIPRFKDEIAQPFLAKADELKFYKYNWGYLANKPEMLESASISLAGVSVLVVEGCMTLSLEIADCFHLKLWVGGDAAQSNQQGIRRDIEEYGLEEQTVLKAWREWEEWEGRCLNRDDRRERADYMIP